LYGLRRASQPHPALGQWQAAHYNDPIVIVGASEMYEARCRRCHEVPRD